MLVGMTDIDLVVRSICLIETHGHRSRCDGRIYAVGRRPSWREVDPWQSASPVYSRRSSPDCTPSIPATVYGVRTSNERFLNKLEMTVNLVFAIHE